MMSPVSLPVSRLSGYAPALPTPFYDDNKVDLSALAYLCNRQVRQGANALVVCGTTGEAPTLARAEHGEIIRVAAEATRGRIPVIAGAGSNSTTHAIELARDAEAAGADALLCVVPYYNKPTQAGLLAHFAAIANSVGLPIILYDVPSRTACGLADETIARLTERPQFIGLKDATGDVTRPCRLRPQVGSDFRLLSGDDASGLAYIAQGGNGCMSVTSKRRGGPVPQHVFGLPAGRNSNRSASGGRGRATVGGTVPRSQSDTGQIRAQPARRHVIKGPPPPGRAGGDDQGRDLGCVGRRVRGLQRLHVRPAARRQPRRSGCDQRVVVEDHAVAAVALRRREAVIGAPHQFPGGFAAAVARDAA